MLETKLAIKRSGFLGGKEKRGGDSSSNPRPIRKKVEEKRRELTGERVRRLGKERWQFAQLCTTGKEKGDKRVLNSGKESKKGRKLLLSA